MGEYKVQRMNGRFLVFSSSGRRLGSYTTRNGANRAISRIKKKNLAEHRKRERRNRQVDDK